MEQKIFHGGNLEVATARFGTPIEGWLDLSTGINPEAYPIGKLPETCWTRLPSSDGRLREAAALAYSAPSPELIVPAPGTQAIIKRLPELFSHRRTVAIFSPTYAEHAHAWKACGHEVREVSEIEEIGDAPIAVLVNPNNPTGRRFSAGELVNLSQRLDLLIVDEAFADVAPELSVSNEVSERNIIVLKSFGKFFGLAGLRLGFAIANKKISGQLREKLGPWAVSGPSIEIGAQALNDQEWIAATRDRLAKDKERLDSLLISKGLKILGGTDLFRLGENHKAQEFYEKFGRAGILVRPFATHPSWLRFGLPGKDSDWQRLEKLTL
jgi:cobalamin biosynthetic protein CobC